MAPVCWLLFAAAWTTSSIRLRVRWWLVTAERVPMMARVIRSSVCVCGCVTVALVAVEGLRGGDGLMAMGAIMWTGEVGQLMGVVCIDEYTLTAKSKNHSQQIWA